MGGTMASSEEEDEKLAAGAGSQSEVSSNSSTASFGGSEGLGTEGEGECLNLTLGGLGGLKYCWQYTAHGSQ